VWVGFRPDSSLLATGSWDGTVRMWPLRRLQAPVVELAGELSDPGYPRIDTLLAMSAAMSGPRRGRSRGAAG
jgi:WD40 repeat protein